jgi:hypothetical protein
MNCSQLQERREEKCVKLNVIAMSVGKRSRKRHALGLKLGLADLPAIIIWIYVQSAVKNTLII